MHAVVFVRLHTYNGVGANLRWQQQTDMANEYPTLRLLAAIIDNGCDDTTPGEVSKKFEELGLRLDDAVERYGCAMVMSGGKRDDPYGDPSWVFAVTVSRALHSHHGYVLLEAEETSWLFRCNGIHKPEPLLVISTARHTLEMIDIRGQNTGDDWDWDNHNIPAPWALCVHDDNVYYDNLFTMGK